MSETTERLDQIEARLNAATPGPWFREYGDVITSNPDPRDTEEGYEDPRHARVVRSAPHLPKKDRQSIADAEFIANAPTDIADLLTLARKQAAALEAVTVLANEDGWGRVYRDTIKEALEGTP